MRLLIILTEPFYKLLQEPKEWQHDPTCESWVRNVGDDQICIVSQCPDPDYAEDDEDRRDQICKASTARLAEIINQLPAPQMLLYLAFHRTYLDPAMLMAKTQCHAAAIASFIHERELLEEKVYPKLWSLVQSPTTDAFEAALGAVMKKQGELRAERVALIRYELMRIFAPIHMDLSDWGDLDLDEQCRAQITVAYKKAVERLVQARPLVYGGEGVEGENLEKIVIESGLAQHEVWLRVQSLLPRTLPNAVMKSLFSDAFQLCARLADLPADEQTKELKRMVGPGNVLKIWCDGINAALDQLALELTGAHPKQTQPEVVSESS